MSMGKALRISVFKIIVLLLAMGSISIPRSFSQISITDTRSFDISFTTGETSRERNGVRLSMNELSRMPDFGIYENEPQRFTSAIENQSGFYYVNSQGETALGTYYQTQENRILAQLPVRNATSYSISSLSIAFDFVFLPVSIQSPINYQLSYRVNGGEWISPGGGTFSSDYLQNDTGGWNTFSMQIMLDQLYLLPNDNLELRWVAEVSGENTEFIPVALQSTELFPTRADSEKVRPGTLIISEIMPRYRTQSGPLEYVELYNSTENPVNLKGIVLYAGNDRVVIQSDLIAQPYSPVVLAGHDGAERFESITDYRYSEELVGNNSGRLILSQEGTDLARALFETSDPGTAVRINYLENAFDGYSGLSNFISVSEEWSSGLNGSPGHIEQESLLFSKTISKEGWYMLDPPGTLSENLNRDIMSELLSLEGGLQRAGSDAIQRPYLYYHNAEADPVRMFASGRKNASSAVQDKTSENLGRINGFQTLDVPIRQESSIGAVKNQDGRQAVPALLSWNNPEQKFELTWHEEDRLNPWKTYLVPLDVQSEISPEVMTEISLDQAWTGLNRSIELSLVPESDSDKREYDNALIGFWDSQSNSSEARFDLPKLWTPLAEESRSSRQPMLYLKSADATHPANSYLNFQANPDELVQVSIGVKLPGSTDRVRIEWKNLDTLPDQWELEFVDAELGESINMRREQSYSFFERSDVVRIGMNDPDRSFKNIQESEYDRFYVRISSTGDLGMFENETESPESFELKQNYPNPFNPATTIGFYLPKTTDVTIGVYNVVGQQVGQLVEERMSAGDHTVTWNAMDMPSGVYIVQMEASNTVQTRKITLIK